MPERIRWSAASLWTGLALSAAAAAAQDSRWDPRPILTDQLSVPESVLLADLDGDGDSDAVVADAATDRLLWFENNADIDPGFTLSHTISSAALGARAVRTGDLDGDGALDVIAGVSANDGRVKWYQSDGSSPPAFTERDLGPTPTADVGLVVNDAAVVDLDGDGAMDVVAAFWVGHQAGQGHLVWYRSNGQPSPLFTPIELSSPPSVLERVDALAVADLDVDGDLDIAAVSRPVLGVGLTGVLAVWTSAGGHTPTFTPVVIDSTLSAPVDLEIGLLNTDSRPDLAVVDQATGQVLVYRNTGGSPPSFSRTTQLITPNARGVEIAPLVGGGGPDIAVASGTGGTVLENTSGFAVSFTPLVLSVPDGAANDVAPGDLDGDGDLDLLFCHRAIGTVRWIERVEPIVNADSGDRFSNIDDALTAIQTDETLLTPTEHLEAARSYTLPSSAVTLSLDGSLLLDRRSLLDLRGPTELVVPPDASLDLRGTLRTGPSVDVSFLGGPTRLAGMGELSTGGPARFADDTSIDSPRVPSVHELQGSPTLQLPAVIGQPQRVVVFAPTPGASRAVAAVGGEPGGGPLARPGSLAIFTRSAGGPDGWSGSPIQPTQAGRHMHVAAGDLDRDGAEDLVAYFDPDGGPLELRAYLSDGGDPSMFTTQVIGLPPVAGPLRVIDLNRDGLTDVVTTGGYYRQVVGGGFQFQPFAPGPPEPGFGIAVEDFDGNGTIDVATHTAVEQPPSGRRVGYRLRVWFSGGGLTPSFSEQVLETVDRSSDPQCMGDCYPSLQFTPDNTDTLAVADLNHDMQPDLIVSEDAGLRVLLSDAGGGGFVAGGAVPSLRWASIEPIDENGDRVPDLAFASPTLGLVGVVRNLAGDGLQLAPEDLLRPVERARGVAVGDLNGDDVPDLAVAATGFDRVAVIERRPAPGYTATGGQIIAERLFDLRRGTVDLAGTTVVVQEGVEVADSGTLRGEGTIVGPLFNAGVVQPEPLLSVTGAYTQHARSDASDTGSLLSRLRSDGSAALLGVGQQAKLAGALVIQEGALPTLTAGSVPIPVINAGSLDPAGARFDTVQTPRTLVDVQGEPREGESRVAYRTTPGDSGADLLPRLERLPGLSRTGLPAIGTPSDAVLFDVAGPGTPSPDGVVDLIIAYPRAENELAGTVAVFLGSVAKGAFVFEPIGLYQGKFADAPVAVEAGDFDGDGLPEIAFGNRGDSRFSNTVHFLRVNPNAPTPVDDAPIPPLPFPRDRIISDLAVLPGTQGRMARGPAPLSLAVVSDTELDGAVTVAMFNEPANDWDTCDIDVCDDPDSVDPIDMDGSAAALGTGFAATSAEDDKVVVAFNTGGLPDTFPQQSFGTGSNPGEVRAADLDDDGFPDLAVVNRTGGSVSIFRNIPDTGSPGGRTLSEQLELPLRNDAADPSPSPSSIAIADLDDDGDLDLAVVSTNASGERAVRWLESQWAETGVLAFEAPADLPEQPDGVPLLVRETDDGLEGAVTLNDDLVVLVDPLATGSRSNGPVSAVHEAFESGPPCPADANGNGQLDPGDFSAWVAAYNLGLPEADQNNNGLIEPADFTAWVVNYNAGCP
ncbi:MAG: FG-GAP repeat domain-containing protein [Phycisphaerales bacterium]